MDREPAMSSYAFEDKANGAVQLTTPVAYMSSLLKDPFSQGSTQSTSFGVADGYRIGSGTWSYGANSSPATGIEAPADSQSSAITFVNRGKQMAYVTFSPGTDKVRTRMSYKCFPFQPTGGSGDSNSNSPLGTGALPRFYEDYDPTNGTVSGGDIYRFGGQFTSGNWDRNATGAGPRGPEQN
jgi:hypothetical protein